MWGSVYKSNFTLSSSKYTADNISFNVVIMKLIGIDDCVQNVLN